jgi:hypothetical protein
VTVEGKIALPSSSYDDENDTNEFHNSFESEVLQLDDDDDEDARNPINNWPKQQAPILMRVKERNVVTNERGHN